MEAIKNRIIKTELVDIGLLTPFQGRLKTLDDKNFNKLRKSIVDEGFSFTVHVWQNADVIYIIDGHQRVSVLTQMRKQGIEIPPISCSFVSAHTYRDAKKLVLLAISQYGKIQKDGFLEFVEGEDFEYDDYDFPVMDFSIDEIIKLKPQQDESDSDIETPFDGQTDDDSEPSEPSDPVDDVPVKAPERVSLGDVWKLGSHVLVCGDSGSQSKVHSIIQHESADAIVTDPPYGLSFMGKEWDKGVPSKELWDVWYSRLKPGGHMLSFSGTRTYHLMTVAIENSGFEVRDMMQWIYGQGFPKSHDISKAIDSEAGAEREVIGKKKGAQSSSTGRYGSWGNDDGTGKSEYDETAPSTEEAQKWSGWGTALKPANEPICLARKPLSESTIAKNVLKHGTGGLNIDGTRIGYQPGDRLRHNEASASKTYERDSNINFTEAGVISGTDSGRFPANVIFAHSDECKLIGTKKVGSGKTGMIEYSQPTQAATDVAARGDDSRRTAKGMAYGEETVESWECVEGCPVKVLDGQSGILKSGSIAPHHGGKIDRGITGKMQNGTKLGSNFQGDSGGASRFFYVAKPSKSERGKENTHATVKPVSLMQYLVRMITQPGGLVLEPFAGSGTTILACEKEGMRCIGFELDPIHCDIILSRWEKLTGKTVEKVG